MEIDIEEAGRFLNDNPDRDEWLETYYPQQMQNYRNAIAQTREQLLNQLSLNS